MATSRQKLTPVISGPKAAVNNFVVKFANVNGTGSASANKLFARCLFRMGLDVVPKNIFPSNIQGLPTWYEVRVGDRGFSGRRGGIDLMVSVNPQSMERDLMETNPGGYFLYDSTKVLAPHYNRDDVSFIGVPLMDLCIREYTGANAHRQRQLFKNMVYVGALTTLLDMDIEVMHGLLTEQFAKRPKLIDANIRALELGREYVADHYDCPLPLCVKKRKRTKTKILMDGNTALALGAIYAGATVAAWYPITPSTSVVDAFAHYVKTLRPDDASAKKRYAIVQAEDELAAIGMVIGANWNGARAFTATSGPGISLMSEFLGLAYFSEVPAVLFDIQRAGPSTGMPTRTQQSDVLSCVYASHGDTKQVLLIPSTPKECFEFSVLAFDLAETLQTPVIVLSDLDLGMNDHLSMPLQWDDKQSYKRGKVLDEQALDNLQERYGRYRDKDGDGICYRTLPGAHPEQGAFFTRGTSRDEYAIYTELGQPYVDNMQRLIRKWQTTKKYIPVAELLEAKAKCDFGLVCYGSSAAAAVEAATLLQADYGIAIDILRLRGVPFGDEVVSFCEQHKRCYVLEQNRDAQMKQVLQSECGATLAHLESFLHYDGTPVTANFIVGCVRGVIAEYEKKIA